MKAEDSRPADTGEEASGQNSEGTLRGAEADVTTRLRTKAEWEQASGLMDAVCERGNLMLAYQRVVENQGAAGVDGIGIAEFKDHLKQHWPTIKAKLLAGDYMPQPVRRVEMPKPQGGGQDARHTNADGSHDPASVASGARAALRGGILRIELRLPTGEACPSSGQGGQAVCCRRPQDGGRDGLGEML